MKLILLATAAIGLSATLSHQAHAWCGTPQAEAWCNSPTTGPSQSQTQSQHQTQTAAASAQASGIGGNGGGGGNVSGSSMALVVPSVGGMASCGGGFSIGGIGPSGGGAGSGMWEFGECKTEREAHTLLMMGERRAAIALMCQIERVRTAYSAIGINCDGATPLPPITPPVAWVNPCPLPGYLDSSGTCHRPSRKIVHHEPAPCVLACPVAKL